MNLRAPTTAAPGHPVGTRGRLRYAGSRDYAITVAEAWRLLADTDHMNRALGLRPVTLAASAAEGGFTRRARAHLLGPVQLAWQEHPFEWLHERHWSVRRVFERGPLEEVEIAAEILPLAGGGVRITISFELAPRGILGRLLAPRFGSAAVESILAYCDGYAARQRAGSAEPVLSNRGSVRIDETRLERALERLSRAALDPSLLPLLRQRLLEGSDEQVLRVRPYALARSWGVDRFEVLKLFLHATRDGLFELRWELMCPACRVPKGETASLTEIPPRFHCEACGIDYETDFDRRVELRFSVHPAIRAARDAIYCLGSPLGRPHIVAQLVLQPGGSGTVVLAGAEPLSLRCAGGMGMLPLVPQGAGSSTRSHLGVVHRDGTWIPDETPSTSDGGVSAYDAEAIPAGGRLGSSGAEPLSFAPGSVLRITNAGREPLVAMLEREAWDPDATTAAEVTTLQEFRDLFSSEVLAPGQEVGVSSVALLFTDLKDSTSLYEGVGDAPAFGRVNRHFEYLRERIAARGGAVVKTIGAAVSGARCEPVAAEDGGEWGGACIERSRRCGRPTPCKL
ncbi:MAG: hypothetical protein H0V09_06170, partial [Gemmatimonadetes bacterium]|nr:hypothetical protein [Gemmatimonadota bacterium]